MYFFFKKIYLRNLNYNNKIDLLINFIPYLNLNFQNFGSFSYFISADNYSKEKIEKKIKEISNKVSINRIYGISTSPEYMILLKFLSAKINKNEFDHQNSNWGFSYYLKSIINRDKIFPNHKKIIDKSDLITDYIELNINDKLSFIEKIHFLTNIKKKNIAKQIENLSDIILKKYLNENQIKIIRKNYG